MPSRKQPKRTPRGRRGRESEALRQARQVLAIEAAGIVAMSDRLDEQFERAVTLLAACRGKVVVAGMGKSGHICRKIAATPTRSRRSSRACRSGWPASPAT
jgi:hypothetical protein